MPCWFEKSTVHYLVQLNYCKNVLQGPGDVHKLDPIYYLGNLLHGRNTKGFYFSGDWASLQLNKAQQGVTNQRPAVRTVTNCPAITESYIEKFVMKHMPS